MSPQQLIDRRYLEEMEKDGTFERLGLKKNRSKFKVQKVQSFRPTPQP